MSYEIKITPISITIKEEQQLFDENQQPVKGQRHNRSFGLGNIAVDPSNPTDEEKAQFKERISQLVSDTLGIELADAIGESKISNDQFREDLRRARQERRGE